MQPLPLRPQPIDIAVMSPEDWIARGRSGGNHVAVLLLARNFSEVRVRAARKVVQQVVNIFDCAEEMVAGWSAGETEEVFDLKNPIHVIRGWICFENYVLVSAGPTVSMPKRVHILKRSDDQIIGRFIAISNLRRVVQSIG